MVSAQEIQRLRQSNQNIENYVDALFIGQITYVNAETRTEQYQRTDRNNGVITTQISYVLEVEVKFNYSLMRSRDGSLTGPVNKSAAMSHTAYELRDLPSVDTLVQRAIDSELNYLARDIVPFTAKVSRTLEKEPDKAIAPQMDYALTLVKNGNYRAALESYLGIYQTHKSVAAAINAAILYEALGEIQYAADFMYEVLSETGSSKARDMYASLNREMQQIAMTSEYNSTRSNVERVASHAYTEIMKVLPANARVWIHNNAYENKSMADDVADNLTSAFLRDGITIIDRQSIALIMTEINLQLSGFLNDGDIVKIGSLAGADTIVIINITGTGAMRRLQVRVLDVEKGITVFQSNTDERWML